MGFIFYQVLPPLVFYSPEHKLPFKYSVICFILQHYVGLTLPRCVALIALMGVRNCPSHFQFEGAAPSASIFKLQHSHTGCHLWYLTFFC